MKNETTMKVHTLKLLFDFFINITHQKETIVMLHKIFSKLVMNDVFGGDVIWAGPCESGSMDSQVDCEIPRI